MQQPVAQIPWGHSIVLLDKLKDPAIRLWYAERAASEGWSRNVLEHQIATHLHLRQGSATTNFAATLPAADSELAQEMVRDPYDLSFLPGERIVKERDLEDALLADIERFMLELGGGLTFAGPTTTRRSASCSAPAATARSSSTPCGASRPRSASRRTRSTGPP